MIAWRINGLISAIQYQIADANETIASSLNQEETKALNIVLDWIEHEMSISKTAESCIMLLRTFVYSLRPMSPSE